MTDANSEWRRERREQDRRYLAGKTLDDAENRMRTRTAKQQLADAMTASRGPDDIPDADDASAWQGKE
jgi:hypothetical protein